MNERKNVENVENEKTLSTLTDALEDTDSAFRYADSTFENAREAFNIAVSQRNERKAERRVAIEALEKRLKRMKGEL